MAQQRVLPQNAQKGRPARPQRVKSRGLPSGYIEGLNDARTLLADFFSILLDINGDTWPQKDKLKREGRQS
jgi:hypothetical protein